LARKAEPFTQKEGIIYKMGQDNKMRKCLTTSETYIILKELREGMTRGHFIVDIIAKKFMYVRYWWPNLFKDTHDFCKSCDRHQRIGRLKTKSLANLVTTLLEEPFMKWGLDLIGPIKPTRILK
jgi:hypothetical protein